MTTKNIILLTTVFSFLIFSIPTIGSCDNGFTGQNPPPVELKNPLTGTTDASNMNILIGQIINAILSLVGSLALVMFIYGGFVWMFSSGNNEKVQKGKDILIWAAIGLIVIFTAYALVHFILADVLKPQ